jgi:hypothetical protein
MAVGNNEKKKKRKHIKKTRGVILKKVINNYIVNEFNSCENTFAIDKS